jgi:uncharacterized protein YwlG (UPF0340 family)
MLHHHTFTVPAQTRHPRSIGGQTRLQRFCPMRGAVFFKHVHANRGEDLPDTNITSAIQNSPALS